MENIGDMIMLIIVFAVSAFLLLVFGLARFINKFEREKQYLLNEMRRAENDNGYRYWHKELRCRYLRLIPFVTKRNVGNIYSFIFYKPKHAKEEKRSDGLSFSLAPSMLAICICAVCLCGASWAWFTASTSIGTPSIKTPSYTITYKVGEDAATELSTEKTVTVPESGSCKITLYVTGTAGATGYCGVKIGNGEIQYYTSQITLDEAGTAVFAFTVNSTAGTNIIVTPKWGSCAVRDGSNTITDGYIIGVADSRLSDIKASDSSALTEPDASAAAIKPSGSLAESEPAASTSTTASASTQSENIADTETTAVSDDAVQEETTAAYAELLNPEDAQTD